MFPLFFAQQSSEGGNLLGSLLSLVFAVAGIVGIWRTFTKAGRPGWFSLIPLYNMIVLLEIAEVPLWWIIGLFIPVVNLVVMILVGLALANQFGKGTGFGVGLGLLPGIFYLILGFDDSEYGGPAV